MRIHQPLWWVLVTVSGSIYHYFSRSLPELWKVQVPCIGRTRRQEWRWIRINGRQKLTVRNLIIEEHRFHRPRHWSKNLTLSSISELDCLASYWLQISVNYLHRMQIFQSTGNMQNLDIMVYETLGCWDISETYQYTSISVRVKLEIFLNSSVVVKRTDNRG